MPTSGSMAPISGASFDLGLGNALSDQDKDETEEQKRKRLGLSAMAQNPAVAGLFGAGGRMGGAASSLGLTGVARGR